MYVKCAENTQKYISKLRNRRMRGNRDVSGKEMNTNMEHCKKVKLEKPTNQQPSER